MYEIESPAGSDDAAAFPMAGVSRGLASSGDQTVMVPDDEDTAGRRTSDSAEVAVVTGPRRSKWGKLRQTVKATTLFASTVSDTATGAGSTRGGRRKPDSQVDDRRESFLKRFSTRQSSCGSSYFQVASAATDETLMSSLNSEPDGKVRPQKLCHIMT